MLSRKSRGRLNSVVIARKAYGKRSNKRFKIYNLYEGQKLPHQLQLLKITYRNTLQEPRRPGMTLLVSEHEAELFRVETKDDEVLQAVKDIVQSGWPAENRKERATSNSGDI